MEIKKVSLIAIFLKERGTYTTYLQLANNLINLTIFPEFLRHLNSQNFRNSDCNIRLKDTI